MGTAARGGVDRRPSLTVLAGAVVVAVLVAGVAAPRVSHHHASALAPTPHVVHRARLGLPGVHLVGVRHDSVSGNWSGIADTGASFTSIGATWTVPTATKPVVSGTPRSGYSSTWVGIGGDLAKDGSLIQAGTEQDATGSGTDYYAWYELLPADSILINHPVSPGDTISVTITETSKTTNSWAISVADPTKSWNFTKNTTYASKNASAEWIEEAPTVNGSQTRMANFGSVTLSSLQVNGAAELAPAGTTIDRIDYANGNGDVLSYPEGYDAAENSFAIQYGSPTALHVTSAALPDARAEAVYSASLTASGGLSPYTWSSLDLPAWLTLDASTGALTGTPPLSGSTSFTAQVKDSTGTSSMATVQLDVLATTFLLVQQTPATSTATAGKGFHVQLVVAQPSSLTGTIAYTTSVSSPGFSVSGAGYVSVPRTTAPGTYTASGTDADVHGDAGTWSLTVKVAHPTSVIIVTTSLPAATVGVPYGVQLVAFGPAGTLRWRPVAGTKLPGGLGLSAGGRLAGTPKTGTAGSHRVSLEALVGAKHAATTLTLKIAA